MRRHSLVRVPATSANLGPGFDALAAALSVHLELEVEETGEFSVGCDVGGVPLDRTNLCVRAFEALHPADAFSFRIRSELPLAAGLGSSAAAIVAGLLAADHLCALRAPVFERAVELEGHPDNAAAALNGGFVICTGGKVERMEVPAQLEGVIVLPPGRVETSQARGSLPAEVPLSDCVHNTAHAALLVLGLARGDLALIGRGLSDRIHQPRREPLYPRSIELMRRAGELGALGASISGSGPAVLFWTPEQQTGALAERLRAAAPDCEVRPVEFQRQGAQAQAL